MTSSTPLTIPYRPALDGVRAVAVISVLFFHSGYSWAEGGYLGVSMFFTLSGFLITALLLTERDTTGRIDAGRFWSRRLRRLLPAALMTLALACLYGATVASPDQLRELRGDVIACLAYVANWRFYFGNQSYADLFAAPSPVLHFWSLAIEEQFYLFFPLLAMGVLGAAKGSRRVFGLVIVGLIGVSLTLALAFGFSQDRIYFGTDTRAAELLVGALLAVLITGRDLPRTVTRAAPWLGLASLGFVVWAMVTVEQSTDALYHGGFLAFGVASALVVLAAVQDRGPVVALLGVAPLVWLGKISYGVYLYHWLVYQWLTPARTGLDDAALFALRVGLTLAMAAASYVLLEQPIRHGRIATGRTPLVVTPVAIGAVALVLFVITISPPPPLIDFAAAEEALSAAPLDPRASNVVVDADAELPTPPLPRVAMFGDSTALMTAVGLDTWMKATGQAIPGGGNSWLGCGVGRGGDRRTVPGDAAPVPENCNDWATTWAEAIDEGQPDLAVVQVGPWEVTSRKLEGDDTWRAPGDPIYDAFLLEEMLAATDLLSSEGAEVVWLTSPPVGAGQSGNEVELRGEAGDPARMARLNELIEEAAAARPGVAHVVPLADYVASTGEDVRLRPDGVHFSAETAAEIATAWLGPELVRLHRVEWIDRWVSENSAPIPDPLRVLVVGDSTAMMLGVGLNDWSLESGRIQLASLAELGCGVGRGGERRYHGAEIAVPSECDSQWDAWADGLETFDPHVVLMLTGPFEVADRRLPNDDTWRGPSDPIYAEWLTSEYQAAADLLTSTGALLVWLDSPRIDVGRSDNPPPPQPYPESDPERMARVNETIADIVDGEDGVETVSYVEHLRTYPGGEMDATMRPDGVHLATATTGLVAAWLGPEIIDRYGEWLIDDWKRDALVTEAP